LNTPPQSATSMDAAYWSFLGGNVGALLPIPYVTVELFTGIEDGNYGFVNGGSGSFGGVTVKAGFNLLYKFTSFGIGIKGEYRRLIVTQDKAGTPAAGVTSFADAFFIGLTTGFF
ncbi:MAG: hypothetical protein ACXWPM_06665, partial [Bdellovibrionota bacterium]